MGLVWRLADHAPLAPFPEEHVDELMLRNLLGRGVSRTGLRKGSLGFLRVCDRHRLRRVLGGLSRVIDRAGVAASAAHKRFASRLAPHHHACADASQCPPRSRRPGSTSRLSVTALLHHGACSDNRLAHLAHVEPHAHVRSTAQRVDAHGLGPQVFHPAAVRLVEGNLVRLLVRHLRLERLRAHRACRASVEKKLVVAHVKCRTAAPSILLARVLASERKT